MKTNDFIILACFFLIRNSILHLFRIGLGSGHLFYRPCHRHSHKHPLPCL